MNRRQWIRSALTAAAAPALVRGNPLPDVAEEVNGKLVKLFGSGGFQRLVSYGSGFLVSSDGFILTVASQLLDTQDLRVHLSDGRRLHAKVVATEPELDAAVVKITADDQMVLDLPHFNVAAAAKRPPAQPGDWVLAFSNTFQIATRDEPLSVQHGVVAAYAKLHGRRGIFDAPFTGDVYVLDAITNNPGAGGGALTTRKGELLGIIGKELRNTLTETWMNYAVPVTAKVEIHGKDGKTTTVTLADFVDQAIKGTYKPPEREKPKAGQGGYHGIVFVPTPLERTPAYIEEVIPGSPADKAGLKPDDLVVYVDGDPVISVKAFREVVSRSRPGTVLKLEVRRGDKLTSADLTLGEFPKK